MSILRIFLAGNRVQGLISKQIFDQLNKNGEYVIQTESSQIWL